MPDADVAALARRVRLAVFDVADAVRSVCVAARRRTSRRGGHGAGRDVADLLLAQNQSAEPGA